MERDRVLLLFKKFSLRFKSNSQKPTERELDTAQCLICPDICNTARNVRSSHETEADWNCNSKCLSRSAHVSHSSQPSSFPSSLQLLLWCPIRARLGMRLSGDNPGMPKSQACTSNTTRQALHVKEQRSYLSLRRKPSTTHFSVPLTWQYDGGQNRTSLTLLLTKGCKTTTRDINSYWLSGD